MSIAMWSESEEHVHVQDSCSETAANFVLPSHCLSRFILYLNCAVYSAV